MSEGENTSGHKGFGIRRPASAWFVLVLFLGLPIVTVGLEFAGKLKVVPVQDLVESTTCSMTLSISTF